MSKHLSLFMVLAAVACGAQRPQLATIPPEMRAEWDRCERDVMHWCADHTHHQPNEERACIEESSRHYVALGDPAARTGYLRSHGCTH